MRLLRAGEHRRMPWKNGGGETIEIAVHPPGAGLDAFDWRLSMARVAGDGPFSLFPGIDRTLAVLAGEGMDLDVEHLGHHRLTRASAPLAFPADAAATARLVDGPIVDLNVMSRRGLVRHEAERVDADPAGEPLVLDGSWTFLVVGSACRVISEGVGIDLAAGDALHRTQGSGPVTISASTGPVSVYLVRFEPAAPRAPAA